MPGYKTHILVGVIFSALIYIVLLTLSYIKIFSIKNILISLVIAVLYSILPDIDHRSSEITWFLLFVSTALIVIGFIFYRFILVLGIVLLILVLIGVSLNHRGFTHSIVANIFLSIPLLYFDWVYLVIGFMAYLSHLFLDKELKLI